MALMLSGYLAHVCTERLAWPMLYNLMLYLPSQILYSYGSGSDSPNSNNNKLKRITGRLKVVAMNITSRCASDINISNSIALRYTNDY